jgi:hypothetical protein
MKEGGVYGMYALFYSSTGLQSFWHGSFKAKNRLEAMAGGKHGALIETPAYDLKADRQAVFRKATGNREAAGWPVKLNG